MDVQEARRRCRHQSIHLTTTLWIRPGCGMKDEVSAGTFQVEALNKAVLVAASTQPNFGKVYESLFGQRLEHEKT